MGLSGGSEGRDGMASHQIIEGFQYFSKQYSCTSIFQVTISPVCFYQIGKKEKTFLEPRNQ